MLKFHTRFPRTWWISSNTVLDMGFPEVLGLAVISHYSSIRDFLKPWPINSVPWSYLVSIGLGYLDSHVVSNKFAIYIYFYHHIELFQTILLQDWSSKRLLDVIFLSWKISLWSGVLLYLHIFYSVVFLQLTELVIYNIFYLVVLCIGKCHN